MSIGEKIKNVRTAKMLTQKDLAGDAITRNMLSKIENGVATPSLPVAIALAERLGVPVGYLLSDSPEEEARFKKYSSYSNIVQAYKLGEWAICRQLALECLDGKFDDQELVYFASQSALQMGIEEFDALDYVDVVKCAVAFGERQFVLEVLPSVVSDLTVNRSHIYKINEPKKKWRLW